MGSNCELNKPVLGTNCCVLLLLSNIHGCSLNAGFVRELTSIAITVTDFLTWHLYKHPTIIEKQISTVVRSEWIHSELTLCAAAFCFCQWDQCWCAIMNHIVSGLFVQRQQYDMSMREKVWVWFYKFLTMCLNTFLEKTQTQNVKYKRGNQFLFKMKLHRISWTWLQSFVAFWASKPYKVSSTMAFLLLFIIHGL